MKMKENVEDIIIVGGGPAGAYLGYILAKNNIKSIIFDHSHPREKPCGGGISAFALKKFSFLHEIPEAFTPKNEYEGELISPEGISVLIKGKEPSWTISRKIFDNFLLNKAIDSGVEFVKEQVIDVKQIGNLWEIKTKKGIYKAKILIGADGVNSTVRKKILGPIPKSDIGVCYGCFAISKNQEIPRVKYLSDGEGYFWCFPRNDHLSIGIGIPSYEKKDLKELLNTFITTYYPDIKIQSKWGATVPYINDTKFYDSPCAGDNWILIGDAAGHVDPITAEGITYALWSAELASKAIINKNISSFDRLWKEEYGEKLLTGCKMRHMFYNPGFLEHSMKIASKSKTFSDLLYDIMQGKQKYQSLMKRMIIDSPKIIKEYFISSISNN